METTQRKPRYSQGQGQGSSPPPDISPTAGSGTRGLVLFFTALALRLVIVVMASSPQGAMGRSPWEWGQEPACLADSLVRGDGFADPFGRGTGPSAWLTPPYPAFLAALFATFGGVGADAAMALFLVQSFVSALVCPLLFVLGRLMGRPRAGRLAGWIFALHPVAAWYAAHQVWDATFVAAGLVALVALVVAAGRGPRLVTVGQLGAAFGALLMINPAPVGVLPALLWYLVPGGSARLAWARGGAFLAGALAVCAPWMGRNLVVMDTAGLRSNLGVELNVGNNDLARGMHRPEFHPGWADAETDQLKQVGEVSYARESRARALGWIRAHPGRFVVLSLRRAWILWLGEPPWADERTQEGLAARDDPRSWIRWVVHLTLGLVGVAGAFVLLRVGAEGRLVGAILLLFPLPYYVVHSLERYRFPLDPLLCLCAAGLILVGWDRLQALRAEERP